MPEQAAMSLPLPPTTLSAATHIKWRVFRLLERLSDLRGNITAGQLEISRPARPLPALWVFVSTIGELNAIDPLLRAIVAQTPQLKLVLITDHPHYRDSYAARYPAAEICVTRGHGSDAQALALHYPPKLLVVAEIPCWPSDAPCRFSFAFLLAAKQAAASVVLVNAWLYHYTTASRMDAIERRLFQRDYVRAFDAIAVQTEETRQHLIAAGADAPRIAVAGNIKFDAMQQPDWSAAQARSPAMLAALMASQRPKVVAGCVTNLEEQEMLLDAFVAIRARHAGALLVLAPRHPEVVERMQTLREYLAQRGLPAVFRSTLADVAIPDAMACLVLDTMGELRDFYAAATVAHVGVDHNVLEPLSFGKPVTVVPGWNATYPSYPVYRLLSDAGTLIETRSAPELAASWMALLHDPGHYRERTERIETSLQDARGAVQRHLDHLAPCMPRPR